MAEMPPVVGMKEATFDAVGLVDSLRAVTEGPRPPRDATGRA